MDLVRLVFAAPAGSSETRATLVADFFQVSFHEATKSTTQEPNQGMLRVRGMSTYVIADTGIITSILVL